MEMTFVLNGQTDSSGHWTPVDVDDLHDALIPQTLLDYSATSQGEVDIEVEMQSIELPNMQPFASATAQSSMGIGHHSPTFRTIFQSIWMQTAPLTSTSH